MQAESYARPTAVYTSEPTSFDHTTRPAHGLDRAPASSSFSALSSAAMDELYALERAEAIRRAEYEIRHNEALRRAEHEARQPDVFPPPHTRLTGNASSAPLLTPPFTASHPEEHGFYTSRERDFDAHGHRHRGALGMLEDEPLSHTVHHDKRSGTSSSRRDLLPLHPHSSGHVVDVQVRGYSHGHGPWNHPYHSAHSRHHLHERHDDSPSPISSDSDSMVPSQSPGHPSALHSHAHAFSETHPVPIQGSKADFIFTPPTSPFLGGLRTLNLHSAVPSRAPSPFHLSPPHLESPIEEFSRSRNSGLVGSPPNSRILSGRKRGSTGDLVSLGRHSYSTEHSTHSSPTGLYHVPYAAEPSLTALPTPQLSSGPSSSGSSPGTHPHSLATCPPTMGGSGSLSASSSRPPSPPLWPSSASYPHHQKSAGSYNNNSSNNNSSHHGRARDHPHHHHIAHSVRVAFGMTPIHPRSRHSASASTMPYLPLPPIEQGEVLSSSDPVSRASSPPIKLPPLKLPSSPSSPSHRPVPLTVKDLLNTTTDAAPLEHVGKDDEQDHLPGFSEVEAAACRRL